MKSPKKSIEGKEKRKTKHLALQILVFERKNEDENNMKETEKKKIKRPLDPWS